MSPNVHLRPHFPHLFNGGEITLSWGPYRIEVAKVTRMDGDALVEWIIGRTLVPARPASAWQLVNDARL